MFQHPEDTLARWRLVAAAWVIGILGACIAMAVAAPPAQAGNADPCHPSSVCIDPADGRFSRLFLDGMPGIATTLPDRIAPIHA